MNEYIQRPSGITEESKKFVLRYLDKIGKTREIGIKWDKEKIEYITTIIGTTGRIIVDGFSIGYNGEGSNGLEWLLDLTRMRFIRDNIFNGVEDIGSRVWLELENK